VVVEHGSYRLAFLDGLFHSPPFGIQRRSDSAPIFYFYRLASRGIRDELSDQETIEPLRSAAMLHSIIIPHRNRASRLRLCVGSILRSACASLTCYDFEIIVSDQHSSVSESDDLQTMLPIIRLVRDSMPLPNAEAPAIFNKGRAINRGIEAAHGDVLTFLDCDAIVGERFMAGAQWLVDHPDITRLCYRVRYLPPDVLDIPASEWPTRCHEFFRRYDEYPVGYEAYGAPEIRATGCWDENLAFGNSQFSIRPDVLGDLRCDEAFLGAGFEDLDFIMSIWQKVGRNYKGVIRTEGDESMFHIRNIRADEKGWGEAIFNQWNKARYYRKWPIGKECPVT